MNNFANKEFVLKSPRGIGGLKNNIAKEIYKHCSSYETMGGSIAIIELATFEEIKEEYPNLKDEDILFELKQNKLYKVTVDMYADCITRYIHLDLLKLKVK